MSLATVVTFALLGLWAFALVDAVLADSARVRLMPKLAWIVVIVLFASLASILWFAFGRPRRPGEQVWRPPAPTLRLPDEDPTTTPTPIRRLAPDDDPEFLRGLDRLIRGEGDSNR